MLKMDLPKFKIQVLINVVVLFVISTAFAFFVFENTFVQLADEFWSLTISKILGIYLIILFLRSGIHLFLSFLWVVFKEEIQPIYQFPLVTILAPCYNEENVIENLIQSMMKITYPNLEILIIDDGSTDSTFEVGTNFLNQLKQKNQFNKQITNRMKVLSKVNGGKADALNFGIQQAAGEYIFCCDADSMIAANSIEIGVSQFLKYPRVAAVAGNIRIGNQKNILTKFQHLEYVSALNFLKLAQSYLGFVTVVPGPSGMFKKSVLQEIGGYNTGTFAEDCDLTMKILLKGYVCIYEPRMIAVTEAPEDFDSLVKQRYRWSRGVLQALKLNSEWILKPHVNIRNFFIVGYLFFETVFMPFCNYLFFLASVFYAVSYGLSDGIIFYFGQLTFLDMVLTFYAIAAERNPFGLVILSVINRVTYSLSMEIVRFFSMFEEILGIPMSWGKLKRKGLGVQT